MMPGSCIEIKYAPFEPAHEARLLLSAMLILVPSFGSLPCKESLDLG
jgi:hypothetical protein